VEVFLWLIIAGVAVLLWRSFFPSYFQEKGKNLATKEDISEITSQIESVKANYTERLTAIEHQNALVLEQLRGQHQLRLAAAERRLAAHQEAFTLWRRLLREVHSDKVHQVVLECQEWWDKNCLYLSSAARESFNRAYFAAASHRQLTRDRTDATLVTQNMALITKAGDDLVSGVELPSLGQREAERAE
jgi:hypothetical protein